MAERDLEGASAPHPVLATQLAREHIEHRSHGRQPRLELCRGETVELEFDFAKATLSAREAFLRVGFADEVPLGDLAHVEAGKASSQQANNMRSEASRTSPPRNTCTSFAACSASKPCCASSSDSCGPSWSWCCRG
jgi:hypothetical protein